MERASAFLIQYPKRRSHKCSKASLHLLCTKYFRRDSRSRILAAAVRHGANFNAGKGRNVSWINTQLSHGAAFLFLYLALICVLPFFYNRIVFNLQTPHLKKHRLHSGIRRARPPPNIDSASRITCWARLPPIVCLIRILIPTPRAFYFRTPLISSA